jgi:hypothetical protein
MNNLAHRIDAGAAVQEIGTIVRADAPGFVVRTEHGSLRALRATSCLVEPRLDDLVLVAATADGRCFILAVLSREQGAGAEIAVDGDLSVAAGGEICLAARDGLKLRSGDAVDVAAAAVSVNAGEASVVFERLTYVGRLLQSEVEKVKSFAGALDMVIDRITQRVKRSYRSVEELDHLRAERIDYEADKSMTLHGETAVVTAERLVKVNGEQIHFG